MGSLLIDQKQSEEIGTTDPTSFVLKALATWTPSQIHFALRYSRLSPPSTKWLSLIVQI
jgi:hypothetical protein